MSPTTTQVKAISNGFSLVEMLVVLVLLALITSIVFPNFVRMYDGAILRSQKADVMGQITDLGFRAYVRGEGLVLATDDTDQLKTILKLPEGWVFNTEQPIIYKSNGMCLGGEFSLRFGSEVEYFALPAPFCQPEKQQQL